MEMRTVLALAIFGTPISIGPARAASTRVEIVLEDRSTSSAIHGMHMTATPSSVHPGKITLDATNESKELVHEVVVVKVGNFRQKLPYNAKRQEVAESRVDRLGEIDNLKPGRSGTLTLQLRPGNYVLLCNQPGHYKQGMWTTLKVQR